MPNSEVRVNWVKSSADGLLVEKGPTGGLSSGEFGVGERADETEWTVLGRDSNPPFFDGRAPLVAGQPEVRRFRGRYIVNDEPVGNYSAVAIVTTVP